MVGLPNHTECRMKFSAEPDEAHEAPSSGSGADLFCAHFVVRRAHHDFVFQKSSGKQAHHDFVFQKGERKKLTRKKFTAKKK